MSDLQTALQSAADEGIITKNQAEMLFPYLVERTVFEGQSAARGELLADRRGNTENPLEDS